jgi:MauM/NapG family ferredoxin protein
MIHFWHPSRQYVRVGCFVLAILLLWPLPFWLNYSGIFVQASPFVTICAILAGGTFGMGSILGLAFSVIALIRKRWFCRNICPVGLLMDGASRIGFRKTAWWRKCPSIGRYIALLTAAAAVVGYPLFLWMDPLAFFSSAFSTTRRMFLAISAGVGLGLLAERVGNASATNTPLRPPGAIEEEEFEGQCVRCGNCIRACPSKIIHRDNGKAGVLGLLAPVVRYEKEYCVEKCNACTKVCPSGALQKLNLKQKYRYVIGEARLNASLCFLVRGVNDCDICVRSCPFNAVQIYWDEELYVAYPVVDSLKCNGCGACEVYCPIGDVKAIRVWKSVQA